MNAAIVDCECGKVFKANMSQRPSERDPTAWEVGLECPHCKTFFHSYWENPLIVSLREALVETGKRSNEGKQARRRHATTLDNFTRQFDLMQKRLDE